MMSLHDDQDKIDKLENESDFLFDEVQELGHKVNTVLLGNVVSLSYSNGSNHSLNHTNNKQTNNNDQSNATWTNHFKKVELPKLYGNKRQFSNCWQIFSTFQDSIKLTS